MIKDRIIVALDVDTIEEAVPLVQQLSPYAGCFKVGLQLITSVGVPQIIRAFEGANIFLDGKFNDIPNTMGKAAAAASRLGVMMFNVHASSGKKAMAAAVKNKGNAKVLAVTVLTSLNDDDTRSIFNSNSLYKVVEFAEDAKEAGADGIICSPQELEILGKQKELAGLMKVTPGVRPEWAAAGDQKRIMTPGQAIRAGATALVIGRPITSPPPEIGTPVEAVKRISDEIAEALGGKE